jgi:hypothetical protein
MALLELVEPQPDWLQALGAAVERPPGVPERRAMQSGGDRREERRRPEECRRVADDLAWLREAVESPEEHGLRELRGTAAVAVYDAEEAVDRLARLQDRGVLDAAGFLLHDVD